MTPVILLAVAGLAALAAPWLLDAALNRHGRLGRWKPSTWAQRFHPSLWIADLHCDALLWNRDLLTRHARGHVDVPRLLAGNVALQVCTVVTKMPVVANFTRTPAASDLILPLAVLQRWPLATWTSLAARARHQAAKLHRFAAASNGRLLVVRTADDLADLATRHRAGPPVVGALLGIEGAHALEGRIANLDAFFLLGFRLLGFAHFFDNAVAGSAHGRGKGGLTPLGRQVFRHMEALGMAADLAHASARTLDEVTALATKPVLVSHTGLRGTCDNDRNLTDAQVERVAATGGVIGIGFFRWAVGGGRVEHVVDAIQYATDLVGSQHVALGSDFDGAVRAPVDAAGMLRLTDALLTARFTDEQVVAIMGENARRVLSQILPRRLPPT